MIKMVFLPLYCAQWVYEPWGCSGEELNGCLQLRIRFKHLKNDHNWAY